MSAEGRAERETRQRRERQLRFAVLGPVRAWFGPQELVMGSPQQRALLAALLLREGRTATAEELIDDLWGDEPPDRAKATVRTYASRIRKSLGTESGLLATESGGYAIRAGGGGSDCPRLVLDVGTVTTLVIDAEKAATSGDRARARDLYADALSRWDGEPLAGLPGPYAETQRARLAEWRLTLQDQRLELELQLGQHNGAVGELAALARANPLRERLRELLMLALYRSGRQADALEVFTETRRLLADELGVDPSPALLELHQRILEADESLLLTVEQTAASPGRATVAVPAQLPASVADFTGRAAFVSELRDQLAQADGTVMAVSAVAGIGGVGKTTLAVHVAHAAADHFPDGQLYVDLQGAGSAPAEPYAVLGSFLRSLGVGESAIPEGVEERSGLFRSLLASRRVLTLLDNARDAAQVRPLLPGTGGCAALITSRGRLVDLAGAHLIDLDVMSPEEAMTLFSRIVGEERVSAERKAAMDVVGACGFLPLAIRIAASRLASRRTWTVSFLAAKLADERSRLDELQAGDQAVAATFELGYGQLDREQARTFRLLGLAEGPDISVHAAAALLGRSTKEAEEQLESLVDTSLLESAAPGRYRLHDLIRLFARSRAERDEQPLEERNAALLRLLDFYLATATRVFTLERPGERAVDHLAPTRAEGLEFPDRDLALDWLFTEADCVLACVRQSAERGQLRHAADLLVAVRDIADSGIHPLRYEQSALAVRDAARAAGDALAESRTQTMLTHVHIVAGDFDRADQEAQRAMLLATASGDVLASSWSLNNRGIIANLRRRYADGEQYLTRAVEAFRTDGNLSSEASALGNLALIQLALGRTDTAVDLAQRGLEIYVRLKQRMRMANGRYTLARALIADGRVTEALQELRLARALFRETRQPLWEGVSHLRTAEAYLAAHDPAKAASHAEQALALRGIGGEWMRGTMLTVLGKALTLLGQEDYARTCWEDALAIFQKLGSSDALEVERLLTAP